MSEPSRSRGEAEGKVRAIEFLLASEMWQNGDANGAEVNNGSVGFPEKGGQYGWKIALLEEEMESHCPFSTLQAAKDSARTVLVDRLRDLRNDLQAPTNLSDP